MKSLKQFMTEVTTPTKKHKHDWDVITYNNGHKSYSLTERCSICKQTRKVNPKTGAIQRR